MNPNDVGLTSGNLVLGKHSGRHALKDRIISLGYEDITDDQVQEVFIRFKALADVKKDIFDEDIEAILMDIIFAIPETYKLISLGAMSGNKTMPVTGVTLSVNGEEREGALIGVGPIDAAFKTIAQITNTTSKLLYFAVSSITGGTDAQGEVMVRLQQGDKIIVGQGADPDIITAAAKAYINGLNKALYLETKQKK
jgi:2-isopropylmalate synthase